MPNDLDYRDEDDARAEDNRLRNVNAPNEPDGVPRFTGRKLLWCLIVVAVLSLLSVVLLGHR